MRLINGIIEYLNVITFVNVGHLTQLLLEVSVLQRLFLTIKKGNGIKLQVS